MQDAQKLAEFMYLSYTQKLWESGQQVPRFKRMSSEQQAGWLAAATTAITFITTRNINKTDE